MKKSILNLGKPLTKKDKRQILGGKEKPREGYPKSISTSFP